MAVYLSPRHSAFSTNGDDYFTLEHGDRYQEQQNWPDSFNGECKQSPSRASPALLNFLNRLNHKHKPHNMGKLPPKTPQESRAPSPTPSKLPPIPGSPSYSYASTANPLSSYNLPLPPPPPQQYNATLTKKDLELSQTAYSDLLSTAKTYRLALAALSKAASGFGGALESCARLKEARSETLHSSGGSLSNSFTAQGSCTADNLLSASGVHQLIANHQQILSETVYRSFEVPLLHELDAWRRHMEEEEVAYLKSVKERSREIRKMEMEGLKLHKMRKRDVAGFRGHLVDLTRRLDDLTTLHGTHSRGLLRDSQETSVKIVEAASSLVRAEVDIFESLARKGWSGGGLDELLDKGADLFANEADTHVMDPAQAELFSILPNKSILAETVAAQGMAGSVSVASNSVLSPVVVQHERMERRERERERPSHRRSGSSLEGEEQYQSLAGAVIPEDDSRSIFSVSNEGHFNRSRGVRPFSPPPRSISRAEVTEDEFGGPLSAGGGAEEESTSTWAAAALPNIVAQDFGTLDGEDENETVQEVRYDSLKSNIGDAEGQKYKDAGGHDGHDGAIEKQKEEDGDVDGNVESDEDDAATMTPKLSEFQRLRTEDSGSRPGTRERRWSVTDDDVVSE